MAGWGLSDGAFRTPLVGYRKRALVGYGDTPRVGGFSPQRPSDSGPAESVGHDAQPTPPTTATSGSGLILHTSSSTPPGNNIKVGIGGLTTDSGQKPETMQS